jgi:exopolysaccharide biosynthesis protein
VKFAFQSYPALLRGDGEVPPALREGETVNLSHRDARLALGVDRAGRLLVALTRFDAPLPASQRIPFGVTLPEMAAIMGALGARQAVSLDGGISAQLLLRGADGETHRWPGLRKVPLALVATPRP